MGLVIGSFVNVVIYRLPEGRSLDGRSKCPKCNKQIAGYDLIPVISFFILRAKCRNCHAPISWLYPAVELYSGLAFLVVASFFESYGLTTSIFLTFIIECLLILAVVDFQRLIIPDLLLVAMLLGVVIFGIWQRLANSPFYFDALNIDNFIGAGVLFLAFFLMWQISNGKWIGFGDVKLVGLIGLIFGIWGGLAVLYIAVTSGAIIGLTLLLTGRARLKTKLPLGTFIGFAATAYIFVGAVLINKLSDIFTLVPRILK